MGKRKKPSKSAGEGRILDLYTCSIIVIIFVLLYQVYIYSGAAFDNFVHPALNWTCSKIGNYSRDACEALQTQLDPTFTTYEYYDASYAVSNDYGEVPLAEIDYKARQAFPEQAGRDNSSLIAENPEVDPMMQRYNPPIGDPAEKLRGKVAIRNKYKNDSLNHLINGNENQDVLPSFIIMGVMKCGTGAINKFLRFHPDLRTCGETYFFSDVNYHKGLDWYKSIMPRLADMNKQVYEKTPTYYRTPKIAKRIHDMNSTIKLIYVVCDNARRTLSRYFHLENMYMNVGKTQMREKYEDVGMNLKVFNQNLNATIDELDELFSNLKDGLDDPTNMAEFVELLYMRYIKRQRPFNTSKYSFRESILADGLYSVYLNHYLKYFKADQILTIDGSELMTSPAMIMTKVQKFLGVSEYIKEENFILNEERGMYCLLKQGGEEEEEDSCFIAGTKGRTTDKHLDAQVNQKLHKFFAPFDAYLSVQTKHKPFDWNY